VNWLRNGSLGVAFLEGDARTFRGSPGAGLRNEVARDVNAADRATAARSEDREISSTASHVEHVRVGLKGLPRHEFRGDIFDGAGDLTEVAGFPGRLLTGFDDLEVWDGRGIERRDHVSSGA
jgi:hypothetical protein